MSLVAESWDDASMLDDASKKCKDLGLNINCKKIKTSNATIRPLSKDCNEQYLF